MKKLILAVLFVSIILCGFIAILNSLPFLQQCNQATSCCSLMESDGKCKDAKEGCKNSEQRIEKKWMDAAGKYHKEIKVISTNENNEVMCPMAEGDHSGCCKCCLKNSSGSDSINYDSVHIKVRHPL